MGLLLASTSACPLAVPRPLGPPPAKLASGQSPSCPLARLAACSAACPSARLPPAHLLLLVSAVDFVPGERLKTMPQNQERIKRDERKKKERMWLKKGTNAHSSLFLWWVIWRVLFNKYYIRPFFVEWEKKGTNAALKKRDECESVFLERMQCQKKNECIEKGTNAIKQRDECTFVPFFWVRHMKDFL